MSKGKGNFGKWSAERKAKWLESRWGKKLNKQNTGVEAENVKNEVPEVPEIPEVPATV